MTLIESGPGIALGATLAFFVSLIGTRAVLTLLRRRAILDHPNERSSHAVPTPRGGGIAVMAALLLAWGAAGLAVPGSLPGLWTVLACALALALVSWIDDLRNLPAVGRLTAHILAVAVGVMALPEHNLIFQGLAPFWLDRLAAGFLWVWFLNLFNFMDGIDGITGVETVTLGVGLTFVVLLSGGDPAWVYAGVSVAAAALGFLVWNWPPARIFIGDVGSVPLGFLLAWLMLNLAGQGHWAPAIILPLYYLGDASLTLARRAARGERVWEAHREHFYQRAIRNGASHLAVLSVVIAINAVLTLLAAASILSVDLAIPVFFVALAAVAAALLWLARSSFD
jgi:UDP-N-acetylmuramyl pentapeptide phosphotransferase/UDP-N-acetylglucosamine-1-phosphate transferase